MCALYTSINNYERGVVQAFAELVAFLPVVVLSRYGDRSTSRPMDSRARGCSVDWRDGFSIFGSRPLCAHPGCSVAGSNHLRGRPKISRGELDCRSTFDTDRPGQSGVLRASISAGNLSHEFSRAAALLEASSGGTDDFIEPSA